MWLPLEAVKASYWHRVNWAMLMSWWVDCSATRAYCGRGWSPIPSVAASREGRSVWPCAAEGLREGAGEAPLQAGLGFSA